MSDQKLPDWLSYDETEGTATITLSRPLIVDGVDRTTLTMREPTVGDQRVAGRAGSAADSEVRLFANVMEIAEADLERMTTRNYSRVQRAYTLLFTD